MEELWSWKRDTEKTCWRVERVCCWTVLLNSWTVEDTKTWKGDQTSSNLLNTQSRFKQPLVKSSTLYSVQTVAEKYRQLVASVWSLSLCIVLLNASHDGLISCMPIRLCQWQGMFWAIQPLSRVVCVFISEYVDFDGFKWSVFTWVCLLLFFSSICTVV